MMKVWFAAFSIGCGLVSVGYAEDVLSPKSDWEYTFTDPTGDASWNTTTGVGGTWALGPAPFGNTTGTLNGDFDFATRWNADGRDGDDLWVRRAVDLTGFDLSTIRWDLGVDNGFKLYANGTLIESRNAEGFTFRWEYTGDFGMALQNGVNVIAVATEDHGGATAFDMQITGDRVIPEPASAAVLALLGLGAAAGRRRRHKG